MLTRSKWVLALTLLLVTSAHAQGGFASTQLIGHWRFADEAGTSCDMRFNKDQTFSGKIVKDGRLFWEFTGRWVFSGRTLRYEYVTSSLEKVRPGATDKDEIIEIGPNHYVVRAFDGSKRKYVRVRRAT
jgi:hypothetical protein